MVAAMGMAARASRTRSVTMASTVASISGGSGKAGTGPGGACAGENCGTQARVNAEETSKFETIIPMISLALSMSPWIPSPRILPYGVPRLSRIWSNMG